jgi:hypothetical protein
MDRKTFIERFARLSILGMFVVFTGFLVSRRKLTHRYGCSPETFCQNCRELGSCKREEAIKYRNNG